MNRIRSFFRYSLGRRLALYFTLMMLLPLSAAGMTVYRASDMRMNNSALQLSAQIVSNVALDLDQLLTDAKSMIDLVIRDDTIQHHINRLFTVLKRRAAFQDFLFGGAPYMSRKSAAFGTFFIGR